MEISRRRLLAGLFGALPGGPAPSARGVTTNAFRVHRGGEFLHDVPPGVLMKVPLPVVEFAPAGWYDLGALVLRPAVAGFYQLHATVLFETVGVHCLAAAAIRKNGLPAAYAYTITDDTPTWGACVSVDTVVEADGLADFFEVWAFHNAADPQTISGYSYETWFSGFRIG